MTDTRAQLLKPLVAVVRHWDELHPWWVTIAGFDVLEVARRYARDCKKANPRDDYLVVPLNRSR